MLAVPPLATVANSSTPPLRGFAAEVSAGDLPEFLAEVERAKIQPPREAALRGESENNGERNEKDRPGTALLNVPDGLASRTGG